MWESEVKFEKDYIGRHYVDARSSVLFAGNVVQNVPELPLTIGCVLATIFVFTD